jgi:hypothetical protein
VGYTLVVFGEIMWTAEAEAHIARHGITPDEVEEAAYGRPRYTTKGRDESTLVFGQTSAGRYLFLVISEAMDGRDFPVTARDMDDDEKRLFREKGR